MQPQHKNVRACHTQKRQTHPFVCQGETQRAMPPLPNPPAALQSVCACVCTPHHRHGTKSGWIIVWVITIVCWCITVVTDRGALSKRHTELDEHTVGPPIGIPPPLSRPTLPLTRSVVGLVTKHCLVPVDNVGKKLFVHFREPSRSISEINTSDLPPRLNPSPEQRPPDDE